MSERLPPHNIDAEEAVIGSLLLGGEYRQTAGLVASDFYVEQTRFVFDACAHLNERQTSINQITLAQKLSEMGKLAASGGAAYLSHLVAVCPTSLDLPYYAEIVRNLATYRHMITIAAKIADIGYQADGNLNENIDKADNLLLSLRRKSSSTEIVTPLARANAMCSRYDALFQKQRGIYIETGMGNLNKALDGGLFPGDLTLIGARTGMGKTTLMRYMARQMCHDKNIFFASLEMPQDGITDMEVAAILNKPVGVIRRGGYSEELYGDILGRAIGEIGEQRIYLVDYRDKGGRATTDDIEHTAEAIQSRYGLDIIFIDYLGRLQDKFGENQNIRLGNIANNLKSIALSLNVPVVVAVQLNRGVEYREDKRPGMADIRESGQIEEAADNIILMYRDKDTDNSEVELIIPKKRYGGNAAKDIVLYLEYEWLSQSYISLKKEEAEAK